jgi:hypothetical protein
MSAAESSADASAIDTAQEPLSLGVRILHVAWMSILLGLAMEVVIIAVVTIYGSPGGGASFMTDALQKVSWSFLVCVGLAIGSAAAKAIRAVAMGLLGLLAAPVAFTLARALNKAASQMLGVLPPPSAATPSVMWLAAIKAAEFACLGFVSGWLATKAWATLRTHFALGLTVGLVFGGLMLAYTISASDPKPSTAQLVALGVNEVFYPVGCALILYAAGAAGSRMAKSL